MRNRRHILGLCTALAVGGCIFGGAGEGSSDGDTAVPDAMASADAVPPGSDTSLPDVSASDVSGLDVGADTATDQGVDGGTDADTSVAPRFDFRPLSEYRGLMPVDARFLGNPPVEDLDQAFRRTRDHIRVVWSAQVAVPDATDPIDLTADFAIVGREAIAAIGEPLLEHWTNPDVPLLVTASSLMNDTHLLGGDSIGVPNPPLTVVDEFHELAVGLPSEFQAYLDAGGGVDTRKTIPAAADQLLAFTYTSAGNSSTRLALLAYEDGVELRDDELAAARRLATGVDEADHFNAWGYWLLDNSVGWLVGDVPQPSTPCTLVTGAPPDHFDYRIAGRMRRNGCDVRLLDDPTVVTSAPSAVVVSPNVDASAAALLSEHPSPVVVLFENAGVLDALRLTRSPAASPVEAARWRLTGSAPDDLRAELSDELAVARDDVTPSVPKVDSVVDGASSFAHPEAEAAATTFFVVPADTELSGGVSAPNERVALAFGQPMWRLTTTTGTALFDAALQWAIWRGSQ